MSAVTFRQQLKGPEHVTIKDDGGYEENEWRKTGSLLAAEHGCLEWKPDGDKAVGRGEYDQPCTDVECRQKGEGQGPADHAKVRDRQATSDECSNSTPVASRSHVLTALEYRTTLSTADSSSR